MENGSLGVLCVLATPVSLPHVLQERIAEQNFTVCLRERVCF